MRMTRPSHVQWTIYLALIVTFLSTAAKGREITVDDDGPADFDNIQAGIDAAENGDTVLVAPGEYVSSTPITLRGKAITVQSQDGPDVTTIRMSDSPADPDRASVAVFESGETEFSVLDGFTVSAGQGCLWKPTPSYSYQAGGGIFCIDSSPTITRCIISENNAVTRQDTQGVGGGVVLARSSAVMTHCMIHQNRATHFGGGVFISQESARITDCVISENTVYHADSQAGGVFLRGASCRAQLLRCTVSANSAMHAGAGIQVSTDAQPSFKDCLVSYNTTQGSMAGLLCSFSSRTTVTNCLIFGNSAQRNGGGVGCGHNAEVSLINCTVTQNTAGINSGGLLSYDKSSVAVKNCIVYGNTASYGPTIGLDGALTTMNIVFSNIEGGRFEAHIGPGTSLNWGQGNVDVDPQFADPNNGDYHLKSEAGRWDPNSESWVMDNVTSPCIDAGDPNSVWTAEIWPHGERINMGALGGTREASMSTRPESMLLPRIAYVYGSDAEATESYRSLLMSYGCPTTLLGVDDVTTAALDSHDLIIVANDTQDETTWSDPNVVAAIEDSGKPIAGLGDGGYDFFGLLGLSIGNPMGGHSSQNSIKVVDPNYPLFSRPYSIEIPEDLALRLYTETNSIGIYLWPTIPETVTVFASEADDIGYFPLIIEHDWYLLWGFTESPQKMTEIGKDLFINVVIRMANGAWED